MNALTKCSAEYPVRFYQNILVIEHKQKAYFAIYMKGWSMNCLCFFDYLEKVLFLKFGVTGSDLLQ